MGEETNRYCVIINSLQGIGGGERGQEPVEISILTGRTALPPSLLPPLCVHVCTCMEVHVCAPMYGGQRTTLAVWFLRHFPLFKKKKSLRVDVGPHMPRHTGGVQRSFDLLHLV